MAPLENARDDGSYSNLNNKDVSKAQETVPQLDNKDISTKKGAPVVQEKEAEPQSETLPGWTIMRPLRMGRLKGKGAPVAKEREIGSASNGRDLKPTETNGTGESTNIVGEVEVLSDVRSLDGLLGDDSPSRAGNPNHNRDSREDAEVTFEGREYRVYKRRWFGLVQLVLLNIVVSWDVSG